MKAETHYKMLDLSGNIVAIIYVATVEPSGKKERVKLRNYQN
jgi:hypothetical protein